LVLKLQSLLGVLFRYLMQVLLCARAEPITYLHVMWTPLLFFVVARLECRYDLSH
jgi:hypothetical protein